MTAPILISYATQEATFRQVFLFDPCYKKLLQWDYNSDISKPSICNRIRNYLLKTYPNGWSDDTYSKSNPPCYFIGFNISKFLHILGLECSLPSNKALPLNMWYNAKYYDIMEILTPVDYNKEVTLSNILLYRSPVDEKSKARWLEILADWEEPHVNPEKDLWLTVELSAQLGFINAQSS